MGNKGKKQKPCNPGILPPRGSPTNKVRLCERSEPQSNRLLDKPGLDEASSWFLMEIAFWLYRFSKGCLPSSAPFLPLYFIAIAATLAAWLDFDVFFAIFWRFYLFSGKPCPSAGLGRCHASPLSGEGGFVEGVCLTWPSPVRLSLACPRLALDGGQPPAWSRCGRFSFHPRSRGSVVRAVFWPQWI